MADKTIVVLEFDPVNGILMIDQWMEYVVLFEWDDVAIQHNETYGDHPIMEKIYFYDSLLTSSLPQYLDFIDTRTENLVSHKYLVANGTVFS